MQSGGVRSGLDVVLRRFDSPDEVREMVKGRFEVVRMGGLTIGRAPDNAVIIDNPSVSGHHARVFSESGAVIVEDLNSTNGTFVNGQPAGRRVLRSGDVLLIGKHQLVFEHTQEWSASPPQLPSLGDTVYLDTKQHRALLSSIDDAKNQTQIRPAPKPVADGRGAGAVRFDGCGSEDHRALVEGLSAAGGVGRCVGA